MNEPHILFEQCLPSPKVLEQLYEFVSRTRQILAAMRELLIQQRPIFAVTKARDLAFLTKPFKEILMQPFVVDEEINALICKFILLDEAKSEELSIKSMKNFPLLFDSHHHLFIKNCLRLKRRANAMKYIDSREHHKENLDDITRSFMPIIGSLSYRNTLTLFDMYAELNSLEDLFKIIREKIEFLKTRAKGKQDADSLSTINTSNEANWQVENTRKTQLLLFRNLYLNILCNVLTQIQDITKPNRLVEQALKTLWYLQVISDDSHRNINRFLAKYFPNTGYLNKEDVTQIQKYFAAMNEKQLTDFMSKALKEGMLIRDKKLSYLILNFALKERLYDRITELQRHNLEAIERNFDKLQLDANSATYLALLCGKSSEADPDRVAKIYEMISGQIFSNAENLRTDERIEYMNKALKLWQKQHDHMIDKNCEFLVQKIQEASLQNALEMELKDRLGCGMDFMANQRLLTELKENIFTEEELIQKFVVKNSLYVGYLNYLLENAPSKQKLIQETLIEVIHYLSKNNKDYWPFNIETILMNVKDKLGAKIHLIAWDIIVGEIERANNDHEYFQQIFDKLDYHQKLMSAKLKTSNRSLMLDQQRSMRSRPSDDKIMHQLSLIPNTEELDLFWLPSFLFVRKIIQPNYIFNIYLSYFNENLPRGDPTEEQIALIYRLMISLLKFILLWLGEGLESISKNDSAIKESLVTLVNYLDKIFDVTERIHNYMNETSLLIASELAVQSIDRWSDDIKDKVNTLKVWSNQEEIRARLDIEASRRPQFNSDRKH